MVPPVIDPAEPPPGAQSAVTGRKNPRPAPRGGYPVVWAAAGLVLVGGSAAIVAMHGSGGGSRPQAAFCGLVECSVLRSEAAAASAPTGNPHPQPALSPEVPSRTAPAPTPPTGPAPTVPPPPAPAPGPTHRPGPLPVPTWTHPSPAWPWPSRRVPHWPPDRADWSDHSRWWQGQSPWWQAERFHQPHWWWVKDDQTGE